MLINEYISKEYLTLWHKKDKWIVSKCTKKQLQAIEQIVLGIFHCKYADEQ